MNNNKDEQIKILNSFKDLKEGWDSYKATTIDHRAIEMAKNILLCISDEYNWHVVPTPDGGVQIEMAEDGFEIEIQVYAV